ncbi:hypothetical protein BH18ACT16_BH18ACT16_11810 [soil metagenome]
MLWPTYRSRIFPEPVLGELRRRASQAGMTVRDYDLYLIRQDQEFPLRSDWAAEVRAMHPVEMDESFLRGRRPTANRTDRPVTVIVDASSLASSKRRRLDAPLLTADRRLAAAPRIGVPITLLPV